MDPDPPTPPPESPPADAPAAPPAEKPFPATDTRFLRLEALLCKSNRERLESLREAEFQRERYRELFEFAPDSYLVTDLNGIVREANRAACDLLNVPRRFLINTPLVSYVSPE